MIWLWWLVKALRVELRIVLAALLLLIFLPALTVVVVAASGLQAVSGTLASFNPVTHQVEIFDTNGNKVADIALTTTWPARGFVSDEFGTFGLFRREMGLGRHNGIDIAGAVGEPVTPFMAGHVLQVVATDNNSCGLYVKLRHAHNITSTYCHLSRVENLAVGTPVQPGDIIGYMGSTGASTGPHLHFMIALFDIPVNPRIFMVGEPERASVY